MNEVTGIVERVAQALRGHGLDVTVEKEPVHGYRHLDARLRIGQPPAEYAVEAKRGLSPPMLGAMTTRLHQVAEGSGMPSLLVSDYVSPPMAEKLRGLHQPFADAAGNAYLQAPGLFVYVTGRKPGKAPAAGRQGGLFTASAIKLLFALICDPALANAPYRTMADMAGVALGAVPAVLAELRRQGRLLVAGRQRRLHATRSLLDDWAMAYAHRLRAHTLVQRYSAPGFADWERWPLDPAQARWGGEPAARLLVRHLSPGTLTLYAAKPPPRLLVEQRLVAVGHDVPAEHLLEVRRPFWNPALDPVPGEGVPATVPPALVYADLLASGDARCIETAQLIHERHLARLFPAS